jgi:alkylation response protein AidB-like acyl-CoA dehydrogenase
VDVRDTPEQAELRRTARQLAEQLGPGTVADLDDKARIERLARAVRDAGWLEVRDAEANGEPLASGVEAAIIADALAGAAADVAFAGPVLAVDLARRADLPVQPHAERHGRDVADPEGHHRHAHPRPADGLSTTRAE